jgi:hypothetical protein
MGDGLNPHVTQILSMLSRKFTAKGFKDKIGNMLSTLEKNGGEEISK